VEGKVQDECNTNQERPFPHEVGLKHWEGKSEIIQEEGRQERSVKLEVCAVYTTSYIVVTSCDRRASPEPGFITFIWFDPTINHALRKLAREASFQQPTFSISAH